MLYTRGKVEKAAALHQKLQEKLQRLSDAEEKLVAGELASAAP